MLKMVRLAKMVRVARVLAQFRDLWFLLRGLFSAANTLFAIAVVLFMMLYVFACIGVELITKVEGWPPEEQAIIDKYFSDVLTLMFTLVQFVFHDSTAKIYRGLVLHDKSLICYFMLFFLFVSVALMNLVTAVVLEGSMDQHNRDIEVNNAYKKEMQKELLPRMARIFEDLDADHSGEISMEELLGAPKHVKDELSVIIKTTELEELFEIMDEDGTGTVSMDEFFECLSRTVIADVSIDQLRVIKKLDRCIRSEDEMNDSLGQVREELRNLRLEIERPTRSF